ncbi:MAG: AAA family ATPase [Bacteroidales bacterium]|nr:AAA family ATPase [Bacteroidales bacterium]MBQ2387092.1 AAA family ATPase [Bacteroidales bacterium]
MKLIGIGLNNFKRFVGESIYLDDRLTVITGENGAGKSSVLDAITIILSWFVARIKNPRGVGQRISKEQIHKDSKFANITAEAKDDKDSYPVGVNSGKTSPISMIFLNQYCEEIRKRIELTEGNTSVPVFVNYGVRRAVVDIPLRIKNPHIFDLLATYDESLKGDANFRNFFEWFRNREDLENERYRENSKTFIEDRELKAVKETISKFMPGFKNLRVKRNPLRMVVDKEGKEFAVNQLSDGEKTYIALIGDLCRRLVLANPTLENPLMGKGIVLIDEIDLHLHPQWQTEIAEKLCDTFPKIQFIVTTHSPLVITNVKTEQLRVLKTEGGVTKLADNGYSYALPVSIILKDVMGIKNELPREIEEKIELAHQYIQNNDLDKAKALHDELRTSSPNLPELVRIRKFIEIKSQK